MLPQEFEPTAPGLVVRALRGHWSFQPSALPPQLTFDAALIRRLSETDLALGELAGLGRTLPDPRLLIRPFVIREAVLSSRIAGALTHLDQLLIFEVEPDESALPADARGVLNYVRAVEWGLDQIRSGQPFSLTLIQELHRILLSGVPGADRQPGRIRDRGVWIGGPGGSYETARFVPSCHTQLPQLLDDFIRFMRDERGLPIIVQLALMHYQFETIHPFNDGNGRIGRLLITLLLCERQALPEPLLYLSAFFEQNRHEYYDALLAVSQRGAWSEWTEFVALGVRQQALDATMRARRLLDLWQSYRRRATAKVRSSAVLRLIDELFATPFLTVNRARDVTGLAFKNAQRLVKRLESISILRETTGRRRDRIYCADEILRLLDAPLDVAALGERQRNRRADKSCFAFDVGH